MKKRKLALYGTAAVAAIVLLPLLALTQPRIATPLANKILDGRAPEGSKIDKAYLNFPQLFTLTVQGVDVPEMADVQRADVTFNPFGFIPSVTWLPKVTSDGGNIIVPELDPEAPPLAINLKKTDK